MHADALSQIALDRDELLPAMEERREKRRRTESELGQHWAQVPLLLAQLGAKTMLLEMACTLAVEELLPRAMLPE